MKKVAQVGGKFYPDKFIKTYASNDIRPETGALVHRRLQPLRGRVPPTVIVRFLLYPGDSPCGGSLRIQADTANARTQATTTCAATPLT